MSSNAIDELAIDVVGFDADDTLWHNERVFVEAKERFTGLLTPYHAPGWIDERLYATEMRNLHHYGYGIKSFTLSMIETAIELTEGRITGREIHRIIELAKDMLETPVELLEGVEETVAHLADSFRLIVVTKGDLFDQEAKIAKSGLGEYFDHVEIVTMKNPATYAAVTAKVGVTPDRFAMVGDSLRSDVLPVLAVGGHAIHVPYETSWEHEHVSQDEAAQYRFSRADSIKDVPHLLREL
jgi:putative hydrolase of the HAD superfamily